MACSDRREGMEKGRCGGVCITGERSGDARVPMNACDDTRATMAAASLEGNWQTLTITTISQRFIYGEVWKVDTIQTCKTGKHSLSP
ncbi:hypothetical protein L1987_59770 [Smallanthus sonchifolius]|uniref:Uncharacterized protein n=1 Tax=Smallanthus sonchifolius TaxID=185202 RepID=A0ACB9D6G2_9ASTR|nr:hypothetical protein L1987_59770 [Smallanthus sonchifolius]